MKKKNEILRQAFIEADIEYFDKITTQNIVPWIPSEKFIKKMNRLIQTRHVPVYKYWETNGKRVACFLLIFAILFGFAFSVEAIRKPVIEFFTSIYEKFSSVFVITEKEIAAPSYIETEYLPTALPEGYCLDSQSTEHAHTKTFYTHNNNAKIIFVQQTLYNTHFIFDTEGAEMHSVFIGAINGRYYINKGYIIISWVSYNYAFSVSVPDCYTIDDAIKIAESVTKTE